MKKMVILLMVMLGMVALALAEEAAAPTMPVLVLEGNRTTGYDWYWEADCDDIVGITGEYTVSWQPENDEAIMPTGVGGQSKFTLHGLAAGNATITFTYRRAWEEKAPLYTLVYHVRVDEVLNVTILSSSFDW